MAFKAL